VLISAVAAVSFVPWLVSVARVYRLKHGVGQNLDWQGHPDLYALKSVWAWSIGVMDFTGATTVALLLVAVLLLTAVKWMPPPHFFDSPIVVTLVSLATLPPIILFLLSTKPFNLPLFGIRHLLPSVVVMALICCYGLEVLALRSEKFYGPAFAIGSLILLTFAFVPTLTNLTHGPSRYPYDRIAKEVRRQTDTGHHVYTTAYYEVGEPVNFYCETECAQPLPTDSAALPETFVLLYRPQGSREVAQYRELLKQGFTTDSDAYYTNGRGSPGGTAMASLTRTRPHNIGN
jgi:hypothetical protein